jgi:hypothetical protein
MSDEKKKDGDLAKIDQIEAESLTDEELESVAGGEAAVTDAYTCSCSCCVATATNQEELQQ